MRSLIESPDWRGPSFKTCANAAGVAPAFTSSRRRELLSFSHHRAVCALPKDAADALLDRAEREDASRRDDGDDGVRHACAPGNPLPRAAKATDGPYKARSTARVAGHAVAHLRLGIDQVSVTIVPHDGNEGSRLAAGSESVWAQEAAADMVLA